jgi:hypothetical protein
MEMKFTASIIEALDAVLRLEKGIHPAISKTERPVWCNFSFFSRITATPIRRTKREEPTQERLGSWMLERTVEFFHHGTRVAVVDLIGQKIDGEDNLDNSSFWAVAKIGYCQYSAGGLNEPPRDWRVIELHVTSLHGHLTE